MFKSGTFNTFRFLLLFILLTTGFYTYIGIVSPGGKTYSPFLDRYANFPAWLTYFICKSAMFNLKLLGYSVYQKALNNVTITPGASVNIIWACLGFGVMSFWTAFVVSHKARWKYKVKWLFIGIGLITIINIIRIDLISLAYFHNWITFKSIDPHLSFNIVSYIAIFILTFWFIDRYKKYNHLPEGSVQ